MGDLFWNKVFGAILAVVLGIMALQQLSGMVFSSSGGGGHHGEEEGSLNEWAHSRFAYYTDIAETGGGGEEEEEVYDLGALLANADASSGERAFQAKCSTCHTIEQGGSNGTGPNLYGVVGAPRGSHDGFGYSGAMQSVAGEPWTWEDMDSWLENPSSYLRGTTMAFAGLRRDDERADVLAYLASYSPDAPPMPEPLPEEEPEGEGGEGEATDASAEAGEGEAAPADAGGESAPAETTEETTGEGDAAAAQPEDAAEQPEEDSETTDSGETTADAAEEGTAPETGGDGEEE